MISVFNRWDTFLFSLDYISARQSEEINGEDILTVTSYTELVKGYRLLWYDELGTPHEHIVDSVKKTHDSDGEPINVATCLNSICETWLDWIEEKAPTNATTTSALATALEPTRWSVGTVEISNTYSTRWYHIYSRECINEIIANCGGELRTDITVSGNQITKRAVSILSRRGAETDKRFIYSKDIETIERTMISDDVITRLRGFGKGEEVGDSYGRRINFADINDGKDYIEDDNATAIWGLPDGKGGIKPAEGDVIFEDCEDPEELLELTKEYFDTVKEPKVSYSCNTVDMIRSGYEYTGTSLGDTVLIIDKEFNPELRLYGRITRLERNVAKNRREDTKPSIVIGNIVNNLSSIFGDQAQTISTMKKNSSAWDAAAYTSSPWLNQVIEGLNAEFAAGLSYKYESPEHGILLSSVPLDDEFKPLSTPAKAMQLIGGGFRIANELNSDGTFKWRTFGDGDGFTADVINAGVIRGGNSYWNLETGELFLKDGAIELTGTLFGQSFTIRLSPTAGLQLYQGSTLVGGLVYQNGRLVLRAAVLGTASSYIDVKPIDGSVGMSFYIDGTESLRFQRGGRIDGGTIYSGIWIKNPRQGNAFGILLQDNGSTYISNLVT